MHSFSLIRDYLFKDSCPVEKDWSHIELFNKWHRHGDPEGLVKKSGLNDPTITLRILLHRRAENRDITERVIKAFANCNPQFVKDNLHKIIDGGDWGDLLLMWDSGNNELLSHITYMYCKQLELDVAALEAGLQISTAALSAPNERSVMERSYGIHTIFCEQLRWSKRIYRKNISALRTKLRDSNSQQDLTSSSESIAPIIEPQLHPAGVISGMRNWNIMTSSFRENFDNCLCICDSGPIMDNTPMNIAIALTLMISQRTNGSFRNTVTSFSETPKIRSFTGDALQRIATLEGLEWGYTLDITALFTAFKNSRNVPRSIYILTGRPIHGALDTTVISESCATLKTVGLIPPEDIFYWNLQGDTAEYDMSFYTNGVTVINGFDLDIYTFFSQTGDLTPDNYLRYMLEMK